MMQLTFTAHLADRPAGVFEYGLPASVQRSVLDLIEMGMGERVCWAALLRPSVALDTYRSAYGNKPKKKEKREE